MQHQVHRADPKHRHATVVIEPGKRLCLKKLALLRVQPFAGKVVRKALLVIFEARGIGVLFKYVLVGIDKEAGCSRGGVTNALRRLSGQSSAPSCE